MGLALGFAAHVASEHESILVDLLLLGVLLRRRRQAKGPSHLEQHGAQAVLDLVGLLGRRGAGRREDRGEQGAQQLALAVERGHVQRGAAREERGREQWEARADEGQSVGASAECARLVRATARARVGVRVGVGVGVRVRVGV